MNMTRIKIEPGFNMKLWAKVFLICFLAALSAVQLHFSGGLDGYLWAVMAVVIILFGD